MTIRAHAASSLVAAAFAGLASMCEPEAGPPRHPNIGEATAEASTLHLRLGVFDDRFRPTRSAFRARVEVRERPGGDGQGAGDVVCAADASVEAAQLEEAREWTAVIDFALAPACPPPPPGPERVRELAILLTAPDGSALPPQLADPPVPLRGALTRDGARLALLHAAEAAARPPAEPTLAPTEARARVDAWRASLAALTPLVPRRVPEASDASCGEVAPGSGMLVDYWDLEVHYMLPADAIVPHQAQSHRAARDLLALARNGVTDDAAMVPTASRLPMGARYVWVLSLMSRTDPRIVSSTTFEPGSLVGGLWLADRETSRVLCGARVEARNGSETGAYTTAADAQRDLREALELDLDQALARAIGEARTSLAGGVVTIEHSPE